MTKTKQKKRYRRFKELYKYYHYRCWCYQKAYTHYKKVNLASNIVSASSVVIGSVAGGITANPIIIGTVTGAGVLLKTCINNISEKLADLKTWLRGGPFNKHDFLKEVNILYDTIIDFCPLETKFEKQYGKKFLSTPTTNSN